MDNRKEHKEMQFIDYFIKKEEVFLLKLNSKAFYHKDFKFYIGWFICAINDYIQHEYDIEDNFAFYFNDNCNLNTIFAVYIFNKEFIEKVIKAISEYTNHYKLSIY